jgi:dolichol kinase
VTTNSTPEAGISPSASEELSRLHSAATIDYRHEIVRKGIHICSLSIPIIYSFIDRSLALQILIPIMAGFVLVDLARHVSPRVAQWFYRWFGWLLRRHEQVKGRWRLNGASHVLIAATLSVLFFPKIIAINAIAILIISDTTSALIGRRYGKHRFIGKSLEGSAAFLVSAVLVVLVAPKVDYMVGEYLVGFAAALVGTLVEAASVRIDDNLSIPLSIGLTLWALYSLLLPAINLAKIG